MSDCTGRSRLAVAAALLALAVGGSTRAQDAPAAPRTRPKIGLVLSGGGARGAAHIGVLEALEEMHVPVDYVAGTSMGSIVGGMYAAGLSPAEIRHEIATADWGSVFTDATPRQELAYRRKQDDRAFLIDLGLGIRDGSITMPRGVIEGQKVEPLFRGLTLHVIARDRFDDLPLPYRAVATQLGTGDVVVLDHGDLATAMRASMSIASVFTPVEIEGKLLVDGGYAQILPVETGRAMGADIIIAVDISTPPAKTDKLTSLLSIQLNVLDVLMLPNLKASIAALHEGDIFLAPPVNDISSSDFGRALEAADIGLATTRAAREQLSRLSVSDGEWQAFLAKQRAKPTEPPVVRSIRIVNDSALDNGVLLALMRTAIGAPLDVKTLGQDLERIYGLDLFESVDYTISADGVLTITARQKKWGPYYLRLGLALQDDFKGNARYGIGASLVWNPVNARGAEWRNELQIGTHLRAFSEFYQPLDVHQRWFIAPSVEYDQSIVGIYDDQSKVAELNVHTATLGIDVGRLMGEWGELRVGYRSQQGSVEVASGTTTQPTGHYEQGGLFSSLGYDTFDSRYFPTRGVIGATTLFVARDNLGVQPDFESIHSVVNVAQTFGRETFVAGLDIGTTLEEDVAVQNQFTLGGFGRLSGLKPDSLVGNQAALARLVAWHRAGAEQRTSFSMPLYLGGSLEAGNVWQSREDAATGDLITAGSLFLGLDTPVGPLYFGVGLAEGGHSTVFLYLGRLL
jgi:NTE family protein